MSRYSRVVAACLGQRMKNGGDGVGIEIEVEGRNLLNEADRVVNWNITTDGSLRGEGYEYVLKGPLNITAAKTALKAMEDALKARGSVVNDAHRGSVHVHINMQNRTIEQVFTTLYLWMIVEPLWVHMCGPQRDGNLFCLPSYLSGDLVFYGENLLKCLRDDAFFDLNSRGKYSSINTDALITFGSLEFRTFPSQTKAEVLSGWLDWCNNLCNMGSDIEISDLTKVWKGAKANPRKFFTMIFGKDLPFKDSELDEILDAGIDSASGMILVAQQHVQLKVKTEDDSTTPV